MRSGPNLGIVFHWILCLALIGVTLYILNVFWPINLLVVFIISPALYLNKTDTLRVKGKHFTIKRSRLLFITSKKSEYDLDHIEHTRLFTIDDYGFFPPEVGIIDIILMLAGVFFYQHKYKLTITHLGNIDEFELNISSSGAFKLLELLKRKNIPFEVNFEY